MLNIGLNIYLMFVVSWFLHLPQRVPFLGLIRFDLILLVILSALAVINRNTEQKYNDGTSKYIKYLIIYIILTIPLVEWPGSVLRHGFENFIKAVVFYYFSVIFIDNRKKLIVFLTVFLGCQIFRVIEPVYLHLSQGYWGSFASMQDWEFMNRLSGAPSDIINPNGLAAIILNIIPFFYFLSSINIKNKIAATVLIPICLYALALTGSRSGIIGVFVISFAIITKSKHKLILLAMLLIGFSIGFSMLDANLKDRYTSMIDSQTKNYVTFEGRKEGLIEDFKVSMRRPLFGHGLGTSREANVNYGGVDQLSHTLYTEVLQELGIVGLIIFLSFMGSIIINYKNNLGSDLNMKVEDKFMVSMNNSIQVWFFMNLIFSFASYGLSNYEWYLFAGLSAVTRNIMANI